MLNKKGAYALILKLDRKTVIAVGALGGVAFKAGYYTYVGSAMAGIKRRIKRYFKPIDKPRWHIDYLLKHAIIVGVVVFPSNRKREDVIARRLARQFNFVDNFGAGDSKLKSHLFYSEQFEKLRDALLKSSKNSVLIEF